MGEFHLRDGFTFERVSESGDVRLRVRDHHGGSEVVREVTVPENEWASVVASVSVKGESGEQWLMARAFHAGKLTSYGRPASDGIDFVHPLDDVIADLRGALLVAADDLDKAANQFQGLYDGILRQYVESGQVPGVNVERFAEKAQRAREAADA